MSRENVEVAREAHAAFNARDLDRFLDVWHADCEYRPALEGGLEGGGGIYRGHDGIRRWWQEMRDAWSDMGSEMKEIQDLGDGRLLVSIILRVRAETDDMGLEAPFFQVITSRDGRLLSSHDFSSKAAALEAVGLSG
jgi:ketosteroid isomerase-like protein